MLVILQIGDEIIEYTQCLLETPLVEPLLEEIILRTYPAGTPVFKYELGGVNLRELIELMI